ncbi:lactosylceramide 4-alpha-galactosyltransferase-like [Neocloeon triangulifer]|uniref:lactosylceramide 4-alpha-galactosyltransferase-like n=1 Tax=Neocloeon triangulifer TaxID=2078957 RepID=UPI00286F1CB1|nr:lactosylceramide 4-alpha-galactosyltransferase-like [Neocloeon triangulifer]
MAVKMRRHFRLFVILLVAIVVLFSAAVLLLLSGNDSRKIIFLLDDEAEDDLTGHEQLQFLIDLTPMLDDPADFQQNYGDDVIFFTETSGTGRVHVRAVCTLEAVSTFNPETHVFLVFTRNLLEISLSRNPALADLLKRMQNVHLATVDFRQAVKDTPLEELSTSRLAKSPYPNEHLSDLLRLGLLWKLGGTYMDLDLLTFKSLAPIVRLKNFLTADAVDRLNTCMLGFQRNHPFLEFLMKIVSEHYDPFEYPTVPQAFNIATRKYFDLPVADVLAMGKVSDVSFLNVSVISPVEYEDFMDLYGGKGKVGLVEKLLENSFGVHLWGSKSSNLKFKLQSKAPFVVLAKKLCPRAIEYTPRYL